MVKVNKFTDFDGVETPEAGVDGFVYELPGDNTVPFSVDLTTATSDAPKDYARLNVDTGADCDNRGKLEYTVQLFDDCGVQKSEEYNFEMTIIERECKDAKLWLFGPTFLETRAPATEDNTNIFVYIMHEGVREITWNDNVLDDANSYGHNASECVNCVAGTDATDPVLGTNNACGDVRWALTTKFDTAAYRDIP